MDDLLNEFLTETSEALAVLDVELVKFEQDPTDSDILGNIFRLVHTIKGTSGFLGLPRLEKVAHFGEDVLGKFRDGELEVTPEAVTLILKAIDHIKALLGELEDSGSEPEGDDSAICAELRAMAEGRVHADEPEPAPAPVAEAPPPEEAPSGPMLDERGFPVAAELLAEVEAASAGGKRAATEKELVAEMEVERETEKEVAPPPVPAPPKKGTPPAKQEQTRAPKESSVAAQSIRVNVDLLEDLMTLVSELVLTRNQLLQMVRGHDDSEFKVPLQRLSHITSDLQEGVMKTRMQPIGNAWAKLPRIVRDLALETNKKIDLQMLGADTELDRQVLELIKDPLTHMVRNSADHGLEQPADRLEANKAEVGIITLNAFHEGGHIIIEISDDGRGLNLDRIRAKVVGNGLATESELEAMTDHQIQQFILKPGFSTAEKITSVSGRGVGMDVVRTNVEKIGGTIEFKSVEGRGSTFTIKIPLTLAIVSALIIECATERFAIPQISVLELVRASANDVNAIEMINEAPVLRLRNRLLPLVGLRDLLKMESKPVTTAEAEDEAVAEDELFIVVAQVGTYSFGIIVDRVFDTEEIVVKPVAPILRHISFYSGNTILGDGSVIMILDPNGIAAATGELATSAAKAAESTVAAAGHGEEKSSMLIFRAGGEELKAVPLALVARLEEVEMSAVEQAHDQLVVQYRGHLMPLIPFNPGHQFKEEGRQPILVFTDRNRSMGLVVDQIVDIVEDRLKIELSANQAGLIGSAVIDGKATDIIDAGFYLTQAFADWFGVAGQTSAEPGEPSEKHVLLVDDSPFFRNLLTPLLSVSGYNVTSADSADDALRLRDAGYHFDVIVSDIEMPGMNGFEFARAVRSDSRWEKTPMVALSSHTAERDFERGREVGFNDYVPKFDRDALVSTLAQTLDMVSSQVE
jgi:two-component system, chemotaxis family, sensor kinase CheA